MSYGIYIGKNHTADGHAWLAGYGDEPSSHWLEIIAEQEHVKDAVMTVGVGADADMPGVRFDIPKIQHTARHIRESYSYYKGVPAPITNGGLNEYGVAVRDIWSDSRNELIAMTPKDQRGLNYSDLARIVMEAAKSAREGVELMGQLIAEHGEATYGGNSHIIADEKEAWVVIQFAGGRGLWVAERLGDDDIRASRPGYILEVPLDEHPNFLFSDNFFSFARSQGWYDGGPFDVNEIYGDGKGRWDGVKWIEQEMLTRANSPTKIMFDDVVWALRTPKLTGDTAGYGQIVPLTNPGNDDLRMLWHAAIGPVAAPFSPVFMGQEIVPPEYGMHRYLTVGEAHRFMDTRREIAGDNDAVSAVPQYSEMFRSAVYESKRLLYLMQYLGEMELPEVHGVFEEREAKLFAEIAQLSEETKRLIAKDERDAAIALLDYFSNAKLLSALNLVQALSTSLEGRIRLLKPTSKAPIKMFDQIW